jgi:TrkA domain protein
LWHHNRKAPSFGNLSKPAPYYICIIIINSTITQEDGAMASVEERDLAGIGKRFTVKTNKGDRLIIILQDSGGVELYRESPGPDQNDCVATLDIEEARLVAAIIGRTLYRTEPIERLDRHGLVVVWHTLAPGSYAVGKTPRQLDLSRFLTISIIAVVEKGGERWANPAPDYVFRAESQVALAGSRKEVQECINFMEKGPN